MKIIKFITTWSLISFITFISIYYAKSLITKIIDFFVKGENTDFILPIIFAIVYGFCAAIHWNKNKID